MASDLKVGKSPSETFSLKNCAVVNTLGGQTKPVYVRVTRKSRSAVGSGQEEYYFSLEEDGALRGGELGLHLLQREWMAVHIGESLSVNTCRLSEQQYLIGTISLEIDYYQKPKKAQAAVNTNDLATYFLEQFNKNVFCVGQQFFIGMLKPTLFKAVVLNMAAEQVEGVVSAGSKKMTYGVFHPNTRVVFEKPQQGSVIQLIGSHMGDSAHQTLISPDWDFTLMGIGGLDKEFSDIFRRAFASRVFPPDIVEQLGMKHVRGILLFGPPGTGKTLMARQIGKMLHARDPKIVNGPEIFNKYVGESEANIRNLFIDAENEQTKMGHNSALHIIIMDEIDAICRSRGSLSGSTGIHDTVVNQLLAKMDGVEQLNNILVIGMTNRKDMIDEALLRPGRLEVQMEISLPDKHGRLQILNIHTAKLRESSMLDSDISMDDLAARTKNFSGAEIEGLVRSATSTAMNKLITAGDTVEVTRKEAKSMKVSQEDFDHAIQYDIKAAFGSSDEQLDHYVRNGIIQWGEQVQDILDIGKESVRVTKESQCMPLVSLLLRGRHGSGKTALAAYMAKLSDITFIKVLSPENMVGFNESAKCLAIKKVFEDAYRSLVSCVVIDDIDRLLDYVAIGPRFSNLVLQTLLILLRTVPPIRVSGKKVHRLLIIGTSSMDDDVLEALGISNAFNSSVEVPYITSGLEVLDVIEESNLYKFSSTECATMKAKLNKTKCQVGIKKLLVIIESAHRAEDRVGSLISMLQMEAQLKTIK